MHVQPVCPLMFLPGILSAREHRHDTVSEWLRRWTRNPLGSARRGSNPLGVVCAPRMVVREVWPSWKAAWPAEAHKGGTCSVGLALSGKPSTKGKVLSERAARALAQASQSFALSRTRAWAWDKEPTKKETRAKMRAEGSARSGFSRRLLQLIPGSSRGSAAVLASSAARGLWALFAKCHI